MSLLATLALAAAAPAARLVSFTPNLDFPAKGERKEFVLEGVNPSLPFDEVVPSWNVSPAGGAHVVAEIRAHGDGFDTKWYRLGDWTLGEASRRISVEKQKDEHGNVLTDTLKLKQNGSTVDIRLTLTNEGDQTPILKLVTLSFADSKRREASAKATTAAWGKTIEVPQRAQGNYPRGSVLCSPTSLSMVLWHYANQLNRPDLNKDVPEVEANVWDKVYDGAGNWVFNAAYAGSFPGMRAYVSRFSSIQDLERWIEADLPVICSISLDLAKGKPKDEGSGHLVVLVGFTNEGDPIFNDPARKAQVRYTYTRDNFERAWLHSGRTVYVVHPEEAKTPADDRGLWIVKR